VNTSPTLRVLSLGAGVQSTALAILAARGHLPRPDAAIFADTGWEPAAVYAHLDRLDRPPTPDRSRRMKATRTRTARKPHTCSRCRTRIPAGASYLTHVLSPDHDGMGNTGWWRIAECADCAAACGRPLPARHSAPTGVGA
jgi:hypothetical protein